MKFASLVFLLVPFAVNAADLCVEDNTLKCKELGYTESSCPYGGVACQYDTSLWYCAKWTCEDGRLYSEKNKPTNAECVETAYKDMTCYDCTEKQVAECTNKDCAIGDVYYSDGTCCPVENFDENKIPVGVVYALSASIHVVPYTTEQAETSGFTAKSGRVIALRDLTSDSNDYTFDPDNPYHNSYKYVCASIDTLITTIPSHDEASLLKAFQNKSLHMYNIGKSNTQVYASSKSTSGFCRMYQEGTADYNKRCAPISFKAALDFYPPNVEKDNPNTGIGNWYVPTIGELALLYGFDMNKLSNGKGVSGSKKTTKNIINKTLSALAEKGVDTQLLNSQTYKSSNQHPKVGDDAGYFWGLEIFMGERNVYSGGCGYIRLSLQF